MSLHHEVLEHLTSDANNPMTSAQLYAVCKGANASADISTALSQLFKKGEINRKVSPSGSGGLYLYWKDAEQKANAATEVHAPVTLEVRNVVVEETFADKYVHSPGSIIAGVVDNLMKAIEPTEESHEIAAPGNHREPPTINLKAQIILPAMPNTLVVAGLKPATLDDAYASGGNFVIDVGTLDEMAIEQIIQRWGVEFKAHARKCKTKFLGENGIVKVR